MNVIFEKAVIADISYLLVNDLPSILSTLEEESLENIRLPPFRYVGLLEDLPIGSNYPYALLELDEGIYTLKDRIVKNVVYNLNILLRLQNSHDVWYYYASINLLLVKMSTENRTIEIGRTNKKGEMSLQIKYRGAD